MASQPQVDDQNPLYCPSLPANIYLEELRSKLPFKYPSRHSFSFGDETGHGDEAIISFSSRLFAALESDSDSGLGLCLPAVDAEQLSVPLDTNFADRWAPRNTRYEASLSFSPSRTSRFSSGSKAVSGLISLDSPLLSALHGPPEHGLSPISLNDESFSLSSKAERLRFSMRERAFVSPVGNPNLLHLETAAWAKPPWVGPETPRSLAILVAYLENMLPGLRLQQKLQGLATTHQNVVDILAVEGRLTAPILRLFRTSEVECLDLVTSMSDEGGLNLGARDILRTLSVPDSFLFLQELNFSGVRLDDTDALCFNRLPRLSRVWLNKTGIGNEAIYHMIALKRSLEELDISFNTTIDDDTVPALLRMRKLQFVSLVRTSVSMVGMRRLALASFRADDEECLQVDPPRAVEDYLDCEFPARLSCTSFTANAYIPAIEGEYLMQPHPPLVVSPAAVSQLSVSALVRNLSAHAACNPRISAKGTKEELVDRLTQILQVREGDLAVQALLNGT
ncbi:hypothetical protein C8Q77DRAFT_1192066 [Trametes polyzona]|nr:hypothetical protein C8Q77DRAFT_1192066 [Trametes polyzona]